MPADTEIDVAELLAVQKFARWHVLTLVIGFLVLFIDGLDFNAVNVAAPAILRAWHVDRSAIGIVFGVGNFGILVGTFVFSWVGDRYGRRAGLVFGVLAYSLPALATPFAGSPSELAAFRFLAGCGIGGVIPNVISLLTEIAPAALRATFVLIAIIGYGLGAAAIGGVAAALIPSYGWPAVFVVAGVSGTVLALALWLWLPESMRYQTLVDPESPALRRRVARLLRGGVIDQGTRLVLRNQASGRFSVKLLFQGNLRLATILLWTAFFAEALTFITLLGWQTVMLESAGVSPVEASLAFSYSGLAGIVAMLVMSRLLDRFSMTAAVGAALATMAAFVAFGTPGLSPPMLVAIAVLMNGLAAATHNSLNGLVGAYYPTSIRGNAVGFATGMGRISGIIGPVAAGFFLSARLPLREIALIIVSPYIVVAAVCLVLGLRYRTNLVADGVGDAADEQFP
jgi:AAHS family 4-hydroxybenzoate transporter-like MFS transporter